MNTIFFYQYVKYQVDRIHELNIMAKNLSFFNLDLSKREILGLLLIVVVVCCCCLLLLFDSDVVVGVVVVVVVVVV